MWKIIGVLLVVGTVGVVVYNHLDENRPPVLAEEKAWEIVSRALFAKPATRDWTALRWHRDRKGQRVSYKGWEYRLERAAVRLVHEDDVQVGGFFEMEAVAGEWRLVARPSSMVDYLWEKVTGNPW